MNKISYTKLNNGHWGVRIEVVDAVKTNQEIKVTTKAGEVRTETLDDLIWKGGAVQIWSVKVKDDYVGKMCPQCGSEPLDANLECWECGYKGSK